MGFLEDPFDELRAINAYMARKKRAEWIAQSIPPARVARLNDAAERFPFLTADAAMGTARTAGPLAAETFAMLGELSTRRWMRDHPSGIAYGQRMVKPGMRQASNRRALANQAMQYATQQATRGAEAEMFGGLTDPEGRLRAPADFGSFVSNYKYDPKKAAERAPEQAEDIQRFVDLARRLAEEGEGDEITFTDREGVTRAYNAKTDSFFTPEPGVEAQSVSGALGAIGNIRLPQARVPGAGPAPVDYQTAGPTSVADVARAGFMGLDLPVQEFQGQVRNVYGWAHGKDVDWTQPQSDALISLQEGLDAGSGFFVNPESDVAKERRRREAERGQISGHNVTLGRWVAEATPFAADSKPWQMMSGLVDLGVQIVDPAAATLGIGGKAIKARDLFANPELYEKAGLWTGVRRTMAGPSVAKTLDSKVGVAATERLTQLTSPYEVYRALNRKVNLDLATEIADTRSFDETRGILDRVVGPVISRPSTIRAVGDPYSTTRMNLTDAARKGRPTDMPIRGPIDATDKDVVGREMESWLYNVKGMDDETVSRAIDRVARTTDTPQLNAAIRDALRDAKGILAKSGVTDPVLRSELVRLHERATEEGSRTWIDSMTAQAQSDDVMIAGGEAAMEVPIPLYIEHAPRYLKLPDARKIRRVQSDWSWFFSPQKGERVGELRRPWAALEAIQGEIWKPIALATRIAWPVRVIAEEQIRMAVAGYDSMFNHPLSYLSIVTGKKKGTDILGDALTEAAQHKAIAVRGHGDWLERAARTPHRRTYRKSPHEMKQYRRAWASEIGRLANDPVASRIARDESLDSTKHWFSRGGGNKFRGELAQMHRDKFRDLADADAYIESVARRINQHTGSHADLLEAVRTGKFRGRNIMDADAHLDQGFLKELDTLVDEFGPDQIMGDEWLAMDSKGLAGLVQRWDAAVDRTFGWLMGTPTTKLSRSPMFKQVYDREIKRLDGWDLTDERKDFLAKGFALDATKELLYDLSKKGRTMDALRVVFPFGEAWSEVITRWFGTGRGSQPLGLVWKNPKTIRRFQQLVQGARGEDFGDFMGAPDGKGFFWENQFGEQVFMYPGISQLTETLLGVEVPLTGRVQGLSMFGTVMPGLGPVAQVPVGWLLQNKPGPQQFKEMLSTALAQKLGPFGTVQEQVLPFGSVGAEDQAAIFSGWNYAPPWAKSIGQFITAGDVNGKQWNTAVMEMAGALKSTGDYGDSLGEQNRLMEDAADKARWFYLIKGLAATTAPSAPDGEWMLENQDGNWVRAAALSDELREMRDEDFDTADERFLEKYGPDLMAVLSTPMTTSSVYQVPSTREGVDWVMANPGIEDKLPNVYGFFAPEGGDEDFTLYNAQFRKGQAIRLNPEDWIRLLNHTKGNVEYAKYVEEVGDQENTKAGRAYLAAKREEIYDRFPGWRNEKGKLDKAPARDVVDELYRSLTIPAAANTDAGRGLRIYLEARDEVAAYAQSQDLAWPGTSQAMLPGRLYLNEKAQDIIADHPGFKPLYDFILSRETEELEDVTGGS